MIYVGIDPGLNGAIAFIGHDGSYTVKDTPTLTLLNSQGKSKRTYEESRMSGMLRGPIHPMDACNPDFTMKACIEQVHAMPGQGVVSMFTFGYGYGLWIMALTAHHVSYTRVPPQTWKKVMLNGSPSKEKGASLLRARELFPNCDLSKASHDGRAEALLLAEYCRRQDASRGNIL